MTMEIPPSLKQIAHLVKIANEYSSRDIVIYYWCLYRAVQEGMKLDKSSPEAINFLTSTLSTLEKIKKEHNTVEAITQEVVAQAHVESQAQLLFTYAEGQDSKGIFNIKVVKAFYTSGFLFDVLNVFGDVDENIQSAQKYAKWRSTYINNCLKKGETPVPGNNNRQKINEIDELSALEEDFGRSSLGGGNNGSSDPNNSAIRNALGQFPEPPNSTGGFNSSGSQQPGQYGYGFNGSGGSSSVNPPIGHPNALGYGGEPAAPLQPTHSGSGQQQYQPNTQNWPSSTSSSAPPPPRPQPRQSTGPSKALSVDDYVEAKKYTKYALSALDYDDARTAVENLNKALAVLQK